MCLLYWLVGWLVRVGRGWKEGVKVLLCEERGWGGGGEIRRGEREREELSSANCEVTRFFWLALYAQPALWVGLAIFAIVRLENVIWLSLVGECGFLPYYIGAVSGAPTMGYI